MKLQQMTDILVIVKPKMCIMKQFKEEEKKTL